MSRTYIPPKSLGVAIILSLVIPGLGDLYSDNLPSAVLWFIATIAAWMSMLILVGFLLVPFVMFGACVHACRSAMLFNERHHVAG